MYAHYHTGEEKGKNILEVKIYNYIEIYIYMYTPIHLSDFVSSRFIWRRRSLTPNRDIQINRIQTEDQI